VRSSPATGRTLDRSIERPKRVVAAADPAKHLHTHPFTPQYKKDSPVATAVAAAVRLAVGGTLVTAVVLTDNPFIRQLG